MNESFKTDPSLATSARAAKESGSYLCASNVTPTVVRFIVSVFLCLLCSCRMSSTQMTCSHFRKNRPKKRQKPPGCRLRILSKNRPVPIFGRSTGASLVSVNPPKPSWLKPEFLLLVLGPNIFSCQNYPRHIVYQQYCGWLVNEMQVCVVKCVNVTLSW